MVSHHQAKSINETHRRTPTTISRVKNASDIPRGNLRQSECLSKNKPAESSAIIQRYASPIRAFDDLKAAGRETLGSTCSRR